MAKLKRIPYDGEGTIYEIVEGKRYKLVLSMGKDAVTGKYRRRAETFDGTLKQAIRRMEAMHKERDLLGKLSDMGLDMGELASYGLTEEVIFSRDMSADKVSEEFERLKGEEAARIALEREFTFSEWCERYLSTREKMGEKRKNTLLRDRAHGKHLVMRLSDVKLSMVTPVMIRDMYADMRCDGVGDETMISCHGLLKRIMADAYESDLIKSNPMDKVKRPERTREVKRDKLEPDQARRLVGILSGGVPSAYEMAAYISLATGARLGEVLGLQWKHMNLHGDCPYIEIIQQHNRQGERSPLKTAKYGGKSKGRAVPIDGATVAMLMAWKARQVELLNVLGVEQDQATPVIANEAGNWVTHSNLERWFRTFCVKNGFGRWHDDEGREIVELQIGDPFAGLYDPEEYNVLWHDSEGWPCDAEGIRFSRSHKNPNKGLKRHYDGLRFHWLRHTWASLLVAAGVDLPTLQEWGGWTDPRVPTQIYLHAVKEKTSKAAGLMDALTIGA